MTPQEKQMLIDLNIKMENLERSDRYTISKLLQLLDGKNIQVGTANGTKIATESTQKLGFWGATPIVQGSSISNPSGGSVIDSQARSTIGSILTALRNAGIINT